MSVAFFPPAEVDSFLRRTDPRWKLAAVGLAAAALVALQTLPAAVAGALAVVALTLLSRLPVDYFVAALIRMTPILLLFLVWLPFVVPEQKPLWSWGVVSFSIAGLRLASIILLKATSLLLLMLLLIGTAPLHATLQAAHRLRIPDLLIRLALLTYRFVFVVTGELSKLRIALRVRAFRSRATIHTYRTLGHIAGTLLVRSSERATRVDHAMRCRGFDGRFRSLTNFQTKIADVVFFTFTVTSAVSLLFLDFYFRR